MFRKTFLLLDMLLYGHMVIYHRNTSMVSHLWFAGLQCDVFDISDTFG